MKKRKSWFIAGLILLLVTLSFAPAAFAQSGSNGDYTMPVLGTSVVLSPAEDTLFVLLNQERSSRGLQPLDLDPALVQVARIKAREMVEKSYFDQNSPNYGTPKDMLSTFNLCWTYSGENIALASSMASAHRALTQTPDFMANIINQNFNRVGIGVVEVDGYSYCVELFAGGQQSPTGSPGGSQDAAPEPAPTPAAVPSPAAIPQNVAVPGLTTGEQAAFLLVNRDRSAAGLTEYQLDSELCRAARLKAKDFVENNYFGHTSPVYGSVRSMLTSMGVQYVNAGESLVVSYNVTRAHNALMNSSGNRANILSSKYSRIGVGIAAKGSHIYLVEIFTDGGAPPQQPGGGTTQPPVPPTKPPVVEPPQSGTGDTDTAGLTADEQRMLSLVNAERAKQGLPALKANLKLTQVARLKAKDMIDKKYFSHTSPTYGSPFDMMRQFGVSYRTAGENLAGAPTVDSAHTNLMNSPGHRANILNGSFKEVGIGILSGSQYGKIFVQMFIG